MYEIDAMRKIENINKILKHYPQINTKHDLRNSIQEKT